jgi:hypothetical protein
MAAIEHELTELKEFLPEGAFEYVNPLLNRYGVHLTVTRKRSTLLGDYRPASHVKSHRITVNGNLHPYAFLVTLIHELAHLLIFIQYGNTVESHGYEWKNKYGQMLKDSFLFVTYPKDIKQALINTANSPAATSCGDVELMRVLKNYDPAKDSCYFVESLPEGAVFKLSDGRTFKRGKKMRKRYLCQEVETGLQYAFSPVVEVYYRVNGY